MKRLIRFWKQDIINKLIVIVCAALLAGVFAFSLLLINMPEGRSLSQAFADFLPKTPTPTFDLSAYLVTPTSTRHVPRGTNTPFNLPTPDTPLPTATLELTASTPEAVTPQVTGTPNQPILAQFPCIPGKPPVKGHVLEVVDGNTLKVLIEDLMYVVRYIGVKVPLDGETKEPFGRTASFINGQLVYGEDILMIQDVNDKDPRGRLLRYVLVGDVFANYEMIREGYAVAADVPPDSACAKIFTSAESDARQLNLGQWSGTPMP